jgi:hypothetical protein
MNDISEWYTDERACDTEVQWLLGDKHQRFLRFVNPIIEQNDLKSVIEFGCGSGIVAEGLPGRITNYFGIDTCQWFLDRAVKRLEGRMIYNLERMDARSWVQTDFDLALAFAFFKHFSLDEWESLLGKLLAAGRNAIFDMQLAEEAFDDGSEYHHTFVTQKMLGAATARCGHVIKCLDTMDDFALPSGHAKAGMAARNVLVWTQKCEEIADAEFVVEGNPTRLVVDGKTVMTEDLHRYAVRWSEKGPELYRDGRRIVRAWQLQANIDKAADTLGESANTAD